MEQDAKKEGEDKQAFKSRTQGQLFWELAHHHFVLFEQFKGLGQASESHDFVDFGNLGKTEERIELQNTVVQNVVEGNDRKQVKGKPARKVLFADLAEVTLFDSFVCCVTGKKG